MLTAAAAVVALLVGFASGMVDPVGFFRSGPEETTGETDNPQGWPVSTPSPAVPLESMDVLDRLELPIFTLPDDERR